MDLIDRLIQFPSMLRSIDNSAWIEHLIIYPFFGLLYILQSLRYQADLIDDGKEYVPPVLANDGIYTWYRMGIMHEMQRSAVPADVMEDLAGPGADLIPENVPVQEPASGDVATGLADEVGETTGIEPEPLQDGKGTLVSEDKDTPAPEKPAAVVSIKAKGSSKPRVIVNSLFIKTGAEEMQIEDAAYFNAEEEDLSGFARFLRQRTTSHRPVALEPEEEEITEASSDTSEDPEVSRELPGPSPEAQSMPEESPSSGKKKKKKKKKDLVDRLVQQSVLDNELLVSEPFAELLYAQGYREKAVKIYEKLMDKNPEKKIIFAAKIDKINKENI